MKSITVHGMDDALARRLTSYAQENGMSLNQTIKTILAQSLGCAPRAEMARRRDFEDLCGVWSKREQKAFERSLADFEKIDPEEWK